MSMLVQVTLKTETTQSMEAAKQVRGGGGAERRVGATVGHRDPVSSGQQECSRGGVGSCLFSRIS